MISRSAAIETRILVVSNNIFRRELLCFQLDEAGYRVYEACDAAEAQEIISTVPIHILILDTRLPHSEAVLAAARRSASNPALIVITDAIPTRRMPLPTHDCSTLTWPYEHATLLRMVQHRVPIAETMHERY